MKGLLLISLLLGAILATKSETNEEKIPLKANDIENKEQNIGNRIEEEELEIQNISPSKKAQKIKKKQKQIKRKRAKKLRKKSAKGNRKNKGTMKKKKKKSQKNKKKLKQKQKQKQTKRKRAKKLRKKSAKGNRKNKDTMKKRKKKQNRAGKKKRKQIKKKKKKGRKGSKKTQRKKNINKKRRKKKMENEEKEKPKKKIRKKKGKWRKNLGLKVTVPSCDEIILSRIKLERKAVNYMRQFNRSTRFMGKTENKLKKKDIWQKSTLKDPQDPISLLIKCGGGDETKLVCAGSTSNKNSVTMMTLLSNLKNCTPNIGSDCKEDKFPPKDNTFDACATSLMGFQAMSQECLKKDGAGACDCYKKADAVTLYDAGKACDAPKMQQYERSVLKTKDNCVTKFKDCRKYQDELASVMMLCCGEGGECKAS